MEFNSSTEDVLKYLQELKQYVFAISDTAGVGTDNLIVLLNALTLNLTNIKQRSTEELQFLLKRHSKVSRMLSALEDSKKYQDNIDYRYDFYKSNTQNIITFSGFMMLINLQLDDTFKNITQQGSELRREKHALEFTIQRCNSYIEYIVELEPEIANLISRCESI